jgi:hypothetical protein
MDMLERSKGNKMLTSKMISDAVAQIWASESNNVTIIYGVSCRDGSEDFQAECGIDRRRLTARNYREVLNDMFYDYCCENASWMGMS